MMRKTFAMILAGTLSACSWGFDSPVTQGEAYDIFTRAAQMLNTVLQTPIAAPAPKPVAPLQPATRAQIINSFSRIFVSAKPKFKYTPKPVRFDKNRLNAKDTQVNQRLQRMIAFGFVAPVGPLAAGNSDTLTIEEFGEALGFYLARMAELTQLPDPKWSPGFTDDRVSPPPKKGSGGDSN